MNHKHTKKNNGLAHCPHCKGIILRDFKFNDIQRSSVFKMRCPHCQDYVIVVITDGEIVIQKFNKSYPQAGA